MTQSELPPPPAAEAAPLSSATPAAVSEADTPTAPELRLPATGIAVIFSFSSPGEGARAGAGPGVCIGTETLNVSASPCRSTAVPRRKVGWVGTSTTGVPRGSLADPASRAAPAKGGDFCRGLDQPKNSASRAVDASLSWQEMPYIELVLRYTLSMEGGCSQVGVGCRRLSPRGSAPPDRAPRPNPPRAPVRSSKCLGGRPPCWSAAPASLS